MAKLTVLQRLTTVMSSILSSKGIVRQPGPTDEMVDVGLTSLDMVNLILAVEAEFDITIPAEEFTPANLRSVASLAALVDRHTEQVMAL